MLPSSSRLRADKAPLGNRRDWRFGAAAISDSPESDERPRDDRDRIE
jgi:hypothetical protein